MKKHNRFLTTTFVAAILALSVPEASAGRLKNFFSKKKSGSAAKTTQSNQKSSKINYGKLPATNPQPKPTSQRATANNLFGQSPTERAPKKPDPSTKIRFSQVKNTSTTSSTNSSQQNRSGVNYGKLPASTPQRETKVPQQRFNGLVGQRSAAPPKPSKANKVNLSSLFGGNKPAANTSTFQSQRQNPPAANSRPVANGPSVARSAPPRTGGNRFAPSNNRSTSSNNNNSSSIKVEGGRIVNSSPNQKMPPRNGQRADGKIPPPPASSSNNAPPKPLLNGLFNNKNKNQ